jgi:hypothetical protein
LAQRQQPVAAFERVSSPMKVAYAEMEARSND